MSALAGRAPLPAGGALALVTLSGTAALGAKMAGLGGIGTKPLEDLSAALLRAAEQDTAAYAAALTGGAARLRCLEEGLCHLALALDALDRLGALFDGLPPHQSADVAAAARLARAGAQTLLVNLAVNLDEWSDALGAAEVDRVTAEMAALRERLEGG